ncbi:VPA1262 family N-terminal domain-containing protein [Clostridium sp. JN-1]|uniref:VPA1262 family N-terminal domain-containing protein n=1 Tax=Clostridium sp. JN-1 TaxID=2483110 RepID=UPI000F0B6AC7|nr:VPA1262 family N-terminal domain-containing protein [Clostridium sp. JN-1]
MGLFDIKEEINYIEICIFAIKKDDNYDSIFTIAKKREGSLYCSIWTKIDGPKHIKLFRITISVDKGHEMLRQIYKDSKYSFSCNKEPIEVNFGKLLKRDPVFFSNETGSTIDKGLWPGNYNKGFYLTQWYRLGFDINKQSLGKIYKFINKYTGMDVENLNDFIGSILYLEEGIKYETDIRFNPDNEKVIFVLKGELNKTERIIIIELNEGKEATRKNLYYLGDKRFIVFDAPFPPTSLGYEIYEKDEKDIWILKAREKHVLIRRIHMDMGIVTGKLIVNTPKGEESEDIVVRDRPIKVNGDCKMQPWINDEYDRIKSNTARHLKDLGSIFVRAVGEDEKKVLMNILKNKIFDSARERLWLWDPYLDDSVIDVIIRMAITNPSMDIRFLLSECEEDTDLSSNNAISILKSMKRSFKIFNSINKFAGNNIEHLKNFKVRNWYKKDRHTFHDRFIISDMSVWSLGSSIKDLGNYHTTIYRMDGELPEEVASEFEKAWEGNFYKMQPNGIEIFPGPSIISRKESVKK